MVGAKLSLDHAIPKQICRRKTPLKKLRTLVRQEVGSQAKQGLNVRLMFQDEGRFGLLGKPRRCWAPSGVRPVVGARLLRKFSYAFAAVSPHDGVMDSLILPWVNAHTMSMFLSTVSQRHPDEYIVMVMDQAGWHIAQELEVPKNMRLVLLPPYSPEINPAEHIWDALREDCIGNTVFASLDAADKALSKGLRSLESDPERMQSLTGFNWITSISLKAK
ncbi:MAG: IS630 family transposase [Burkholderiales bacterium]